MKKVKLTESQLKKLLEWQLTEGTDVSDETIEQLYTKIVQGGGFSFDIKNNSFVTEAYFVSANPQLEQTILYDEFENDSESAKSWIKEFIYTNTEILGSNNNVFGAWKASDIRSDVETVFLDVTTTLTDRDAAIKLGCASKQQAIYDGFMGRDIPLTKEVYDENGYPYPFNPEEAPDQDTEIDSQLTNTEVNEEKKDCIETFVFNNEKELYNKYNEIKNTLDFDDEKIHSSHSSTKGYNMTPGGLDMDFSNTPPYTRTQMHEFMKNGKVIKRITMEMDVNNNPNEYKLKVIDVDNNNIEMNINEEKINEVEQTKGGYAVRRLIVEGEKIKGEYKTNYGVWDKSEWNLDGTPVKSINKYDSIVNTLLIK